ncbi:MAG: hypothetical protein ACNA71_09415, partial [Kiritimatiellia bacterium]
MRAVVPKRLLPLTWVITNMLLALIAYRGVITADFIGFDDNLYVSENRIVQQGLTPAGIRWACTATYASTWQPLVWISYMLEITLLGTEPRIFHFTNLLLHLLNVALFFVFVHQLSKRMFPAGIASLLLAIHPVHVESVAWIAERKGLLSSVFGFLAMIAYHRFVTSGAKRYYAAAFLALALGLMAKPMLITLPILFLLIDFWPRTQSSETQSPLLPRNVLAKAPFGLLSMGSIIITSYTQYKGGSFLGLGTITMWDRMANAAISVWRYLWHLIYPVRLALLYPHPGRWPFWAAFPAIIALGSTLWLLYQYR